MFQRTFIASACGPKAIFWLFVLIPVHRPVKPYSLYVIYGGAVASKSGRSCQSPGVCFSSAQRISRATPGPLTQPRGGEALGFLTLVSARAHVWEAPCKCVYSVRLSLLIKEEMSTCSLKHLLLPFRGGGGSHVSTYVCFLVLFKVK